MNTINCLSFPKTNEDIFLAGSRDGIVKLYDLRQDPNRNGAFITYRAHTKKLNQVLFSSGDNFLLSSGRDSAIRLWDIRFINESSEL